MSLSNLNWSGWIVFVVTLMVDLRMVGEFGLAAAYLLSDKTNRKPAKIEIDIMLPAIFTAWLLWLLS